MKRNTQLLRVYIKLLCWWLIGTGVVLPFNLLRAQDKNLFVSKLSEGDGLTPGAVMNFFQDAEGYLWICTIAGLNRYDGNQITNYISDPIDFNSLSTTPVHDVTQDTAGMIWIATRGGGLNSLDPQTEKFTHYRHDPDDEHSIASDDLTYIDVDERGHLWIGSQTALTHFDPATGKAWQFQPAPGRPGQLQGNCRGEIIADSQRIYLGTSAGFEYYDRRTGRFRFFPLIAPDSGDTLRYQIYGMTQDRQGKIWFGYFREGLRVYDPVTDTVTHYELRTEDGQRNARPMRILEDQRGFLWIVGLAEIWRISPDRSHMERLHARSIDADELLSVGLWSIFEDRSGLIWFGGRARQALFFDPRREIFQFPDLTDAAGPGEPPPNVFCLEQDRQGLLWFGVENKLYRYDPKTGEKRAYPQISSINDLTVGPQELIWLATGDGLFRFDPAIGQAFPVLTTATIGAPECNIDHATFDRQGDLWVTVSNYGLCRISREVLVGKPLPDPIRFDLWRTDLHDSTALPAQDLYKVGTDSKGNIWVCGNLGGISRIEKASGQIKTFGYQQGKIGAISNSYTYSVIEGPKGYIWISTNGGGLNKFSPETERFVHYTMRDGLPSDVVIDLAFDRQGLLWLTTPKGISCFDPETERFIHFNEKNGLRCWKNDLYYSRDADLIFGAGEKGINYFSPTELLNLEKTSSPVAIVSVAHFDSQKQQMVRLKPAAWANGHLELSYLESALRMQFATLDFRNPVRHAYRYSLTKGKSPDPRWVDLQTQYLVDFARFEPGQYVFRLEGQNSDGLWSTLATPLAITIRPPFWQTGWAYVFYVLLAGSIILSFYRFNMKRQLAIRETLQLKELNDLKTSFFTNITHEFRTPLTVIIGMLDNIRGHANERNIIRRNGKSLLRLVNQLLDLSKLDSGAMKINKTQGDIVHYLRYLTESFHSMAEEKQIQLVFSAEESVLVMDFDESKMQQITYNLLSNALKFTPKNGRVSIRVRQVHEDRRSSLHLTVSDTGIGISPAQLPHIFDRFYQVDGSITRIGEGTGIGLALTRELVTLMGGSISVESQLQKGTTFTIYFPVTCDPSTPRMNREAKPYAFDLTDESTPSREFEPPMAGQTPEVPLLLIIEDNADVTTYIESILQGDYQIAKAVNGQEGINLALEIVPDIIITDVMMPEKDGYEVCTTLKSDERTSHIPIVMLTAKVTSTDRITGLKHGADAYLMKPFDKEELFVRLEKLIALRQALRARYAQAAVSSGIIDLSASPEKKAPNLDDLFLQKIRGVIEEKIGDTSLGVDDLGEAVHLSRTQVFRKMKAITGESPTGFIRKVRLYKAKAVLETTDLSVSEIAYMMGFADPNYFSRTFSKEFGIPPSAMRE